jgi:hypothetical protein
VEAEGDVLGEGVAVEVREIAAIVQPFVLMAYR